MFTYNYVPDITVSPRRNAIRMLLEQPGYLVTQKPRQSSFHNLCSASTTIPPTLHSLLGLGLNFCPTPTTTTPLDQVELKRFTKDYRRRILFANGPELESDSILYVKNTQWEPSIPESTTLHTRASIFEDSIHNMFYKRQKARPNLLPLQEQAIRWLLDHPELIVMSTDKNLGPAIIEREEYVRLAYRDHLSDTNTYRQLTSAEATANLSRVASEIEAFTITFQCSVPANDLKYILHRTHATVPGNEASFMYLLAKIHKTPMKTRAIISYAGSTCHGIAKWLDVYLKKIVRHMPSVATSSASVAKLLTSQTWPTNSTVFTCDAVSMYTNIHLKHALPMIQHFLTEHELGKQILRKEGINISALTAALELVMNNNVFRFGDTYFLQKNGTAMGTPPAPTYATLYFAIWEILIVPEFPELVLYLRYIDDGLGIWNPIDQLNDRERWLLFQQRMNDFGVDHQFFRLNPEFNPLSWTFSDKETDAIFLDINISLNDGHITTKIYEKPLNLHLYIPPHSCHSPGVLKGFIFGCANRANALCTNKDDRMPFMRKTFSRLLDRGHDPISIRPMFKEAFTTIFGMGSNSTQPARNTNKKRSGTPLFLHLPYNPADPHSSRIQTAFKSCIVQPQNEEHILNLDTMNSFGGNPDFDSLIVCYHGQPNLGNMLSPRKLRLGDYSINDAIRRFRDEG